MARCKKKRAMAYGGTRETSHHWRAGGFASAKKNGHAKGMTRECWQSPKEIARPGLTGMGTCLPIL